MKIIELKNNKELIEYLNNNHNYLVFRGLNFPIDYITKDIDILIDRKEKIPEIKFPRILHFQYEEKHKGIVFVSQKALKRKKWNGTYYELSPFDNIKMRFLRGFRKTINNKKSKAVRDMLFWGFFLLLTMGVLFVILLPFF